MPCLSITLIFDRLTLKLVCEWRLRWGTFIPNLGTLSLWVLKLFHMYVTDRRMDGRKQCLLPLAYSWGHNKHQWFLQIMSLICRHCDLLLFSIVTDDSSSWRLVFQHRLALSAAVWDVAFLTDRHLLVLQASEHAIAVVCTLSLTDSCSILVIVVITKYFVPL